MRRDYAENVEVGFCLEPVQKPLFLFSATGYINIARSLLPARIGVLGRVAPNLVVVVVVVVALPWYLTYIPNLHVEEKNMMCLDVKGNREYLPTKLTNVKDRFALYVHGVPSSEGHRIR